jgi:hypothetical protein
MVTIARLCVYWLTLFVFNGAVSLFLSAVVVFPPFRVWQCGIFAVYCFLTPCRNAIALCDACLIWLEEHL